MPYADPEQHRARVRWYATTPEGKARRLAANQAYRARNREKYKAHGTLNNGVRDGKITRPNSCSDCGVTCVPHGHHEDYSKPLDVVWVCDPCHKKRH